MKKVKQIRFDFLSHWVWAILVFFLIMSGVGMLGSRFGWVFMYDFSLADITHRTLAVLWIIWMTLVIAYEIRKLATKRDGKSTWLPINKKGFGWFNLLLSLVLILTGVILWFMPKLPYFYGSLSFVLHEFFAYVILYTLVWHIYDKRHIFAHKLVRGKRKKK